MAVSKNNLELDEKEQKFIFTGDFNYKDIVDLIDQKIKEENYPKKDECEQKSSLEYLKESFDDEISCKNKELKFSFNRGFEDEREECEFLTFGSFRTQIDGNLKLTVVVKDLIPENYCENSHEDIRNCSKKKGSFLKTLELCNCQSKFKYYKFYLEKLEAKEIEEFIFKCGSERPKQLINVQNSIIEKINFKNIEDIYFEEVQIEKSLNISNNKNIINSLNLKNITFQKDSRVYLKNITVEKLEISDITQDWSEAIFENITVTKELVFEKINFDKTKFVDCDFSQAEIIIKNNVNFTKDTLFNNVIWAEVETIQASRDIFRQLKFVNDSQGNIIKANNFYAQEMKEYKKELNQKSWFNNFQEKLVFLVNEKLSNFGQDWILPILWFLVLTMSFLIGIEINQKANMPDKLITSLFLITYLSLIPISIYFIFDKLKLSLLLFIFLSLILNLCLFDISFQKFGAFLHLKFNSDLFEGYEFLWILHKLLVVPIGWHLVTALQRQTTR